MPSHSSPSTGATTHGIRNGQPGTRAEQKPEQVSAPDPGALTRFIALYEKHYGIRLDPGEASVKARRLLSFFHLIAAHADRASASTLGPDGNALNHDQGVLDSADDDAFLHNASEQPAHAVTDPEHSNPPQPQPPFF